MSTRSWRLGLAVLIIVAIVVLVLTAFGLAVAAAWLQSSRLAAVTAVMYFGCTVLGFSGYLASSFLLDEHRRRHDWREKEAQRLHDVRARRVARLERDLGIGGR